MSRVYWFSIVIPLACMALAAPLRAQDADPIELRNLLNLQPIEPPEGISSDRILGVIPNFQTVSDPNQRVTALTSRQKFSLFAKETIDPYTMASAAAGAGMSQANNSTPKYGDGMAAYSQRLAAAT